MKTRLQETIDEILGNPGLLDTPRRLLKFISFGGNFGFTFLRNMDGEFRAIYNGWCIPEELRSANEVACMELPGFSNNVVPTEEELKKYGVYDKCIVTGKVIKKFEKGVVLVFTKKRRAGFFRIPILSELRKLEEGKKVKCLIAPLNENKAFVYKIFFDE